MARSSSGALDPRQSWRPSRPVFLARLLPHLIVLLLLLISTVTATPQSPTAPAPDGPALKVCIVGAGMGGASAAYFLRNVSRSRAAASASASPPPASPPPLDIHVFERAGRVGGRMLLLQVPGGRKAEPGAAAAAGEQAEGADTVEVEAGASIIHAKNLHLVRLAEELRLERAPPSAMDFGIWAGHSSSSKNADSSSSSCCSSRRSSSEEGFVFQEWRLGEGAVAEWVAEWVNTARMIWRYSAAGLRAMQAFVQDMLQRWMRLYDEGREGGQAFERPEGMLESLGLLDLTRIALSDALLGRGLPNRLINELVTMITRVQYGQNATISGLPGAVGLCGSGSELWKVRGGNWQLAAGAIQLSNASLHLHSRVARIARAKQTTSGSSGDSGASDGGGAVSGSGGGGGGYVLYMEAGGTRSGGREGKATDGNGAAGALSAASATAAADAATAEGVYCDAVIIATPMEQNGITIDPAPPAIPLRTYQHTHTTFVRGILNHTYFGAASPGALPGLIGTMEREGVPFSSISLATKLAADGTAVFKVFSRQKLSDDTLSALFRNRSFIRHIDWPAYPHYSPPDSFAPFLLDEHHLYYTSTFESAASALETAAVAAKNVAQLLLSRLQQQQQQQQQQESRSRGASTGGDGKEPVGLASAVGTGHEKEGRDEL